MKNAKQIYNKLFGPSNTFQHRASRIPAKKIVLITAKEVGKNTFCDFLKILAMEKSALSNTATGRNTESAAVSNLRGEFNKNYELMKLLSPNFTTEYRFNREGVMRFIYQKREDVMKNQWDKMFSFENLNKISGFVPKNAGIIRYVINDEMVSLDNIKTGGKLMSEIDVIANEEIIKSTVRRTIGNVKRRFKLMIERVKDLKYNKKERKCNGCKSKGCYGYHNTSKTKYKTKICKKKKQELINLTRKLRTIDTKEFKNQMFYLMNPWDERFYYVRYMLFHIPIKRFVDFIFPKCFPMSYYLEKYSDRENNEMFIEEVSKKFDQHKDKIWKSLFKNTHLFKYDKDNDTMYGCATVFANHTLFEAYNKEALEEHKNFVEIAIKRMDRILLAKTLGIANNYVDVRGTAYKTNNWNIKRENHEKIKTIIANNGVTNISFGVDIDLKRRFKVSPIFFYNEYFDKNMKQIFIEKAMVMPQFEIEVFNTKTHETYNDQIFKKISDYIFKYNVSGDHIKKHIIFDINGSSNAEIVKKKFEDNFGEGFIKQCIRIPALVGDLHHSKIRTGYGILSRQKLTQDGGDSGIINFVKCVANMELIETFTKIPTKTDEAQRLEKSDLKVSGYNWEKRMDTINSFEIGLWARRKTMLKSIKKIGVL